MRNEPLSNRAYFHPAAVRKNFHSPQARIWKTDDCRSPAVTVSRPYLHSEEFEALQSNIRNTISLKMQREYEQAINDLQRDNNNLKQEKASLIHRLGEYENRITGLATQLEVKKAIR